MNDPDRRPQDSGPAEGADLEVAALGYDRGSDAAPRLLGRGKGEIAERILQAAEQHGIPVERDPDLLECLGALEVGDDIPVQAYQAVAQILAFLYAQNEANGAG